MLLRRNDDVCDLRLRRIVSRGLVGSLRLSGCRSSSDLRFLDWLRGHYQVREERCLRPQVTQARQRYSVQGRDHRHQTILRAEIANRHLGKTVQLIAAANSLIT
jgi:hypothetical protein